MRWVAVTALVLAGCSGGLPVGIDRVPIGEWGGEHVRLTVTDTGGRVEFDCAHGTLDAPLRVDTEGRFSVPGTIVLEGGPVPEPPPAPQGARFLGHTDGRRLRLERQSDRGEPLGTFDLERGPGRRPLQVPLSDGLKALKERLLGGGADRYCALFEAYSGRATSRDPPASARRGVVPTSLASNALS